MLKQGNLHYDPFLDACRCVLRHLGSPAIIHCYCEQNKVADILAKEAAKKQVFETIKVFTVPPVFALALVWADMQGTQSIRTINSCTNNHESFILEPNLASAMIRGGELEWRWRIFHWIQADLQGIYCKGGRFGVDKSSLVRSSSIAACLPTIRDDDVVASSSPAVTYNIPSSLMRTSSLPVETEAEWRKRKELLSLRRMEAKRRRSEKVQRNFLRGTEKCMEDEKRGTDHMNLKGSKLMEKEHFLATAKKFGCKLPTLAAFGADMEMQDKRNQASQGLIESQGGCSSSISELESKPALGSAEASSPSIQSLKRDFGSRTP
ncbi:hypothetical protein BC332_08887 [Capsicum chinense]|nr:hypothetical protein BC332_08887 [Capsicum chinense]